MKHWKKTDNWKIELKNIASKFVDSEQDDIIALKIIAIKLDENSTCTKICSTSTSADLINLLKGSTNELTSTCNGRNGKEVKREHLLQQVIVHGLNDKVQKQWEKFQRRTGSANGRMLQKVNDRSQKQFK